MAFLEDFNLTGSLGNLSAYRMKGSDKVVVRTKGGAKKEKIMNDPAFEVPRKYMSEFGACSSMGKVVRRMLGSQKNLADHNISGPINALLKVVQKQDKESKLGERHIVLSKYPGLLEGLSLNMQRPFDSIIRNTIGWSISRQTRSAVVEIPRLIPAVNFFPQNSRPMFKFIVTLGSAPDFFFNDQLKVFQPNQGYQMSWGAQEIPTDWLPVAKGMDALTIEIEDTVMPPDDAYTLVLGIGIRFGIHYGEGIIEQAPHLGAAKVLGAR